MINPNSKLSKTTKVQQRMDVVVSHTPPANPVSFQRWFNPATNIESTFNAVTRIWEVPVNNSPTHDLVFSSASRNQVDWAGGYVFTPNATYTIASGNTGTMTDSTPYYVYFDPNISTTALQVTSKASAAAGANKILIAAAYPRLAAEGVNAEYQVFGGQGIRTIIFADAIVVAQLSAITADMGSLTAGDITLDSAGFIRGGQTAYATGTGFFLGYDSTAYKFSIGDADNYIKWDGTNLIVKADNSNLQLYDAVVDAAGFGDYTELEDAVNAGEKTIYVRSGSYTLTADLSITVDDTKIVGESKTDVLIGGAYRFYINADRVEISNIQKTSAPTDGYMIYVNEKEDVQITDCVFSYTSNSCGIFYVADVSSYRFIFSRNQVYLDYTQTTSPTYYYFYIDGYDCRIEDNIFDSLSNIQCKVSTDAEDGIISGNLFQARSDTSALKMLHILALSGFLVNNNTIKSGVTNPVDTYGIYIDQAESCTVANCYLIRCNIVIDGIVSVQSKYNKITNNHIEDIGNTINEAIHLKGYSPSNSVSSNTINDTHTGIDDDGNSDYCNILGNNIGGMTSRGIVLGSSNCIVSSNMIQSSGGTSVGIYITGAETIVSANAVQNCGNTGIYISSDYCNVVGCNVSSGINGIVLSATADRNTITGNTVTGNSGTGIVIIAGATNNILTSNIAYNNTTAQITDGGTGTSTNNNVTT